MRASPPPPTLSPAAPAVLPAQPAPSEAVVAPTKPVTNKQLLTRADKLMDELKQKPSITYAARVELRRLRRRVEANPDAAELRAIADDVDTWERVYLR